jgi:pSer/pThr/pTyr-binding forkhead associated (FHA) protein
VAVKAKKRPEKRGILYVISAKGVKDAVKLRRDATIFGREKGDVVINDHEISSTHCQIQNINYSYHIFDMNSTNGTYVNNERVVKSKLNDGDVITVGQSSFKFMLENESSVRHIATIFKSRDNPSESKSSLVDTLIESEMRTTQNHRLVISIKYMDGSGEEVVLNQRSLYVGRASSFGRFETDPEISRKHLLVKVNDSGEVFIEDQGSTNGSFLNGKKIKGMHLVRPQDEVKVGTSLLRISTKAA